MKTQAPKNHRYVATIETYEKVKALGLFQGQICAIVGTNAPQLNGFLKGSRSVPDNTGWLFKLAKLLDVAVQDMAERVEYDDTYAFGLKRQIELIERRYQKYLEYKKRVQP